MGGIGGGVVCGGGDLGGRLMAQAGVGAKTLKPSCQGSVGHTIGNSFGGQWRGLASWV